MERLSDKLFINLNRNDWLKFILYNQLYLQFIAFDCHIDYLITKSLCLFILMGGAFVTEVLFESSFKSLLDLSSQSSMSNLGKVVTLQNWQVSQGKLSHSFSTFQNQRWGTIFSIICLWIPCFPHTLTNTRSMIWMLIWIWFAIWEELKYFCEKLPRLFVTSREKDDGER